MKAPIDNLIAAAERVWKAFLAYGPVDDGRPEGDEFDAALTALMEAKHEAKTARNAEKEAL